MSAELSARLLLSSLAALSLALNADSISSVCCGSREGEWEGRGGGEGESEREGGGKGRREGRGEGEEGRGRVRERKGGRGGGEGEGKGEEGRGRRNGREGEGGQGGDRGGCEKGGHVQASSSHQPGLSFKSKHCFSYPFKLTLPHCVNLSIQYSTQTESYITPMNESQS